MEKIEDIQKFETHKDKAKVYGEHLIERLQEENPQRALIGRTAPGYSSPLDGEPSTSTFYLVGEKVEEARRGLRKLLFRESEKELKVLVKLNKKHSSDCSAVILDPSLKDSAERIMEELDEKSGETYSSNIKYSTEELFYEFK